jgi:hypothetical protein
VARRLQALEVTGQEILTRDKVPLRLNLSATWRFTEVLEAQEELAKPAQHLYRELQFGLRAAVGTPCAANACNIQCAAVACWGAVRSTTCSRTLKAPAPPAAAPNPPHPPPRPCR